MYVFYNNLCAKVFAVDLTAYFKYNPFERKLKNSLFYNQNPFSMILTSNSIFCLLRVADLNCRELLGFVF